MKKILLFVALILCFTPIFAQNTGGTMIDQIGVEDKNATEYVKYSFKTDRIINLHSLETTARGVMDVKISHRFGTIDNNFYDLFGLDQATQRIGIDLGLTDQISVGLNRNSVQKAYDAFINYKFLRQSTGAHEMPITAIFLTSIAVQTQNYADPTRINYFSSRLFYTNQLIIGRKFNNTFTLELVPTLVHRNLVSTLTEKNNVFAMGIGGRIRLNKRLTFNAEYIYVLPNQLDPQYKNSLSVGLDIETGGHVFQLHFTNSPSMSEYAFVTQTPADWGANAIRFGFNVSRVFTVWGGKDKMKG